MTFRGPFRPKTFYDSMITLFQSCLVKLADSKVTVLMLYAMFTENCFYCIMKNL